MIVTAVLSYNKPSLTRRCLESARAAGAGRLILVDNGSLAAQATPWPSIETVRLEPNRGFAGGMNAALRESFANPATSRTVLLSNDVELPQGFHDALGRLPIGGAAELLCPHIYYLVDRSRRAYTHGSLDLATFELAHHFDDAKGEIRFPDYYPAAATVWNRAAYERLGGFDERYFCYWEDVALSRLASRRGVALRSEPRLVAHHLGRGTTGGKRAYSGHFQRGRELTLALLAENC